MEPKHQREDMIAKLTALFKELEVEVIDDVVTEAKKRAINEAMCELFDSQIETLESRGCPQAILESVRGWKGGVVSKAIKMNIPKEHIPFVLVIPRAYMGIYGLMSMIRNGDREGDTDLNLSSITDNVETPKGLYFIYDIEDGESMLDKSSKEAEKLIKEQDRFCLTVEESIAMCIHFDVLSRHIVSCTGSRFKRNELVPDIRFDNGRARLIWSDDNLSDDRWGSASCYSRS